MYTWIYLHILCSTFLKFGEANLPFLSLKIFLHHFRFIYSITWISEITFRSFFVFKEKNSKTLRRSVWTIGVKDQIQDTDAPSTPCAQELMRGGSIHGIVCIWVSVCIHVSLRAHCVCVCVCVHRYRKVECREAEQRPVIATEREPWGRDCWWV